MDLDGSHQEGSGNAFAGYIADGESEVAVGQAEIIVIVAGDHAGGRHLRQLILRGSAGAGRRERGEKLALHAAGDLDFRLQALLLFGHGDEAFEARGHVVEGVSELGQLIFAFDRDAPGEIALGNSLSAFL